MTTTIKSADLNLYFAKEVDRLDFTVHAKNANGKTCAIDGFVARVWGTDRYFVNSEVLPVDFTPMEGETFGKGEVPFFKWRQSDGHYTLKGALKHHLETVWGITVTDEIVMPTNLQAFVRIEATKKVVAVAMSGAFDGTSAEHKAEAKAFAKEIVAKGLCFVDKGSLCPRTVPIGVYNFSSANVAALWDERMASRSRANGESADAA